MKLTSNQLDILQHSLGLDSHGQPPENYRGTHDDDFPGCYRNNFYAGPGHSDWNDLQTLTEAGLMHEGPTAAASGDRYFRVTQKGYEAVKSQSPPPPKLSRAKQRWKQFINWQDAYNGTFPQFIEWMKANNQPLA